MSSVVETPGWEEARRTSPGQRAAARPRSLDYARDDGA